jgi:hypothetical protein
LGPEGGMMDEATRSVVTGLISIRHIAYKFDDMNEPEIAAKIRELCDLVERRFTQQEAPK